MTWTPERINEELARTSAGSAGQILSIPVDVYRSALLALKDALAEVERLKSERGDCTCAVSDPRSTSYGSPFHGLLCPYRDSELNERVARALGWTKMRSWWQLGETERDILPHYARSLDECTEIIAEVERRGLWDEFSVHLHFMTECEISRKSQLLDASQGMRDALLATPRQICEAFIAALEAR